MVTMCSWRSRLILSIIAASVVDLPEPVGPVTRTRPRGFSQMLLDDRRQAELAEAADLVGDLAEDGGDGAALVEDVGAEAGQPLDAEGEVDLEVLLQPVLLGVGEDRVGRAAWSRVGVNGGRFIGRRTPSMRTWGGGVGGDVQVGAALLDHVLEQLIESRKHARPKVL